MLHLSNRELKLDSLDGAMELEFAGIMPDSAGPDIAGSSIYRVTNADEFFRKNAGKNAFCDRPPCWVAVNSPTGAPAWSDEIWLGMLTLPDWPTLHARRRRRVSSAATTFEPRAEPPTRPPSDPGGCGAGRMAVYKHSHGAGEQTRRPGRRRQVRRLMRQQRRAQAALAPRPAWPGHGLDHRAWASATAIRRMADASRSSRSC